MDKIKGLSSPGRGGGKGKTRVMAELTGMTEALRGAPVIGDIWVAGKLRHQVRFRVPETTMSNDGGGGSSKSMGGGYAGEGSGGQLKRVERVEAITASEHDTWGKVAYG
jgi:hypothetical protein